MKTIPIYNETKPISCTIERRFVVDEKRCCEFWGFEIQRRPDEIAPRWDAPPGAEELVDRLIAYFADGEPITAISGLL